MSFVNMVVLRVDVIGFMTGISAEREYVRDGKVTKMIVFELTDERLPYFSMCLFFWVCSIHLYYGVFLVVLFLFSAVVRLSVLCLVVMLNPFGR